MKKIKPLIRGSIIYIRDDRHPFLVVSNEKINKYSSYVIVVAMTSRHKRLDLPTHCVIGYHDSMIMAENIKNVNKNDIRDIVHIVRDEDMKKVNECMKQALGVIEGEQ